MRTHQIYLLATLAVSLCFGLVHFGSGYNPLSLFEDDFYYYAVVGRNIVEHGLSSFDGLRPTNGYQPLWMALVVAVLAVLPAGSSAFLAAVYGLGAASAILAGLCMMRLYERLGVDAGQRLPAALVYFSLSFYLSVRGMEVALTLVLMPLFVERCLVFLAGPGDRSRDRDSLLLGACAGLLILSRLDTAIFVSLCVAAGLAQLARRDGYRIGGLARHAGLFLLALLPLLLYFAGNLWWFGDVMPVSGLAKGLKSGTLPSARPWIGLLEPGSAMSFVVSAGAALVSLACLAAVLWDLLRGRRRLPQRGLLLAIFAYPFLYVLVQSMRSDWPLWIWYYYAFVFAAGLACGLLPRIVGPAWGPLRRGVPAAMVAFALAVPVAWTVRNLRTGESDLVRAALRISRFAESHPGAYAMGDRAGLVGYLLRSPVLQLEGLVADRPFLEHIRRGRPLRQVLDEYRIDYYIATNAVREGDQWVADEPRQAGRQSPRMWGRFDTPALDFSEGAWHTLIFGLR